ncbi:putative membrane protein [Streptococcus pneumoniae GA43264]|nr:putative membrane protein [Streptococcus pneumoniae GA47368]EHZ55731.1 putative membrane protein [Streptococcus pneumoniae GA43264]
MKDDQKYLLAGLYSLLVAIFYFPLIESKGIFVSILMAVLLLYLIYFIGTVIHIVIIKFIRKNLLSIWFYIHLLMMGAGDFNL